MPKPSTLAIMPSIALCQSPVGMPSVTLNALLLQTLLDYRFAIHFFVSICGGFAFWILYLEFWILDLDFGFCIYFCVCRRIWRLPNNLSYPRATRVGGFKNLVVRSYEKDLSRLVQSVLLSARLPFGFVCIACTAGNLQQVVGKEPLRQMSMAFAALRLPERGWEVMHIWEISVSPEVQNNQQKQEFRRLHYGTEKRPL